MEMVTANAGRLADCLENPKQASHMKETGVNTIHQDKCGSQTPALKGLESWDSH